MKTKLKHLIFPLIALSMSSCGYGLDSLVFGDKYNSAVFKNNYYDIHDVRLDPYKDLEDNILTPDQIFTTYHEFIQTGLDEQAATMNYFWLPKYQSPENNYSGQRRMSNYEDIFNLGYLSKLYDGQMFCGGDYQLSRVQINEKGFSQYFLKEGRQAPYFAMNFKASIDYTNEQVLSLIHSEDVAHPTDPSALPHYPSFYHESEITLNTSLFVKTDGQVKKYSYSHTIERVQTNHGETFAGSEYIFYGFDLSSLPSDYRLIGYSIDYSYNDAPCQVASNLGLELDYSLMVYEVMFPLSNWN